MGSFSGLGIGLSFVFGCILMGLFGELYYVLWWKKRISIAAAAAPEIEGSCFLFRWKRPCFGTRCPVQEQQQSLDLEVGSTKDASGAKGFGEEGIEAEIMRMHNLCGPPRFLCTIKEESKEDLESEDGKRSRKGSMTKSLSDFFLTPLSSPTIKANNPCLSDSCNGGDIDHHQPNHHGFKPNNPCLSDSCNGGDIDHHQHNHHGFTNLLFKEGNGRFRSSPPPKLKFLRDAEDKLIRKLRGNQTG